VKSLKPLRQRIDRLDDKILELLNERSKVVQQVYEVKVRHAQSAPSQAFVPGREAEILRRLKAKNKGPFPEAGIDPVFSEIISACRSLEISPRIAYFGQALSNTHQAALVRFGSQGDYVPSIAISSVFEEVEQGRCDYGVVPVENSTEGIINHTFDLFVDSDLKVCSEISLAIRHHLLASRSDLKKVRVVQSHPQALAQCRRWLDRNLPGVPQKAVASTSLAAELAAKDKSGRTAAIAADLAAKHYALKPLARNIQDQGDNTTRFFVIGRTISQPTGKDKTSVMLSIRDKVGALASVLKPFEKNKVNLSSIESRPSRRKAWDYFFFVDFHGHQLDPKVARLLKDLSARVAQLKVLGSYPAA
jgi:chorismate mutase/prephenate dehydratase